MNPENILSTEIHNLEVDCYCLNMPYNDEDSKLQNTDSVSPIESLLTQTECSGKSLKISHNNHQGNSVQSLKPPSMSNMVLHSCNFPGCNLNFRSNYDLKRHTRRHLNCGEYKCKICDHLFQRYDELKRHLYTHTDKKPIKCPLCDFCCIQSYDLVKHKYSHTLEKPYNCQTCNKAFTRAARLKEHSRIHTGEQPYACQICNKTFTNRRNLNDHLAEHEKNKHESLEEAITDFSWKNEFRPFKCNVCLKEYTSLLSFKRHMNSHLAKLHTCTICQKSFHYICDLTTHSLTHSNNDSSICSESSEIVSTVCCEKDFNFHTDSLPLFCNISNRRYDDQIQLNTMILSHDDDKLSLNESNKEKIRTVDHKNNLELNKHNPSNNITKDTSTNPDLPYNMSNSKIHNQPNFFDIVKIDHLPSKFENDNFDSYENLNYQNVSSFSSLEDQFLSTEKYSP